MDSECDKCHKIFSNKTKLKRHIANVCNDKSKRYPCTLCAKMFNSELKVKRHVYESHVKKMKEMGSDTHILSKIKEATQIKVRKTAMVCHEEGCANISFPSLKSFRKHLTEIHGKEMTKSTYQFASVEEFNDWKEGVEKEIGICYSGLSGRKKDGNKIMQTFYCRRSGVPRMRGTGKKKPKSQGSCKIGYYCSSTIELCVMDGIYYVNFYEEHTGHDLDVPSLAHTPLPKSDKRFIAGLLYKNYSQEEILQMARDGFQGRLALIKPHDIQNIAKSFNIGSVDYEYLEDNIFTDMNNSSIKGNDSIINEIRIQDTEDFLTDGNSLDDNDYGEQQFNGDTLLTESYNTSDLTAQEVIDLASDIINNQIKFTYSDTIHTTEFDDIENSKAIIPDLLLRFLSGLVKEKYQQLKIAKSITELAHNSIREATKSYKIDGADQQESKFVPGRVAVCVPCGILSADLNFCQKCKTPFANLDQSQQSEDNANTDMSCKGRISEDDLARDNKYSVAASDDEMPLKMEYDCESNFPYQVKKRTFSKTFREKSSYYNKSQIKMIRPISQLEPTITAEMDNYDDMEDGDKSILKTYGSSIPGFDSLAERTSKRSYKPNLTCRSLRIGSYKVVPKEDVYFDSEGITLFIPPIGHNEKELVTINIPIKKIVKILAHIGGNPPVIFLYVTPSMGSTICELLKLTDRNTYYFDPCSSNESQKRITLLPKSRLDRAIFEEIIHIGNAAGNLTGESQSTKSQPPLCTLEELNEIEANEILILSS